MNKIPGVQIDTVEAAHFADDFASKMTNNIIDRNAKLQEMASQMDGTVDKINQLKGEKICQNFLLMKNKYKKKM